MMHKKSVMKMKLYLAENNKPACYLTKMICREKKSKILGKKCLQMLEKQGFIIVRGNELGR